MGSTRLFWCNLLEIQQSCFAVNISQIKTSLWEKEEKIMDNKNGQERQRLLIELENIQNLGVTIFLDGVASSPQNVTNVLYVNEEHNFMRDYVKDEKGVWRELRFDSIKFY